MMQTTSSPTDKFIGLTLLSKACQVDVSLVVVGGALTLLGGRRYIIIE